MVYSIMYTSSAYISEFSDTYNDKMYVKLVNAPTLRSAGIFLFMIIGR